MTTSLCLHGNQAERGLKGECSLLKSETGAFNLMPAEDFLLGLLQIHVDEREINTLKMFSLLFFWLHFSILESLMRKRHF